MQLEEENEELRVRAVELEDRLQEVQELAQVCARAHSPLQLPTPCSSFVNERETSISAFDRDSTTDAIAEEGEGSFVRDS